ncbi:nuclear transport factor 2 family protein [candidate division KSB1 bacterium]|nr:nuclear transport factor 2 family protein [candidate division KSB1 bacterium]
MRSYYPLVFIVVFVLFLNCQQQTVLTELEEQTIKQEVSDQFDQLLAACAEMDAEAWSEYYSKDAFISAIGGTDYFPTRSAWVDSITHYFSLRERQQTEPLEVRVTALTPNHALLTSTENMDIWPKSGEQFRWKHVFTMVWKKEQGSWKILHSHESWTDR